MLAQMETEGRAVPEAPEIHEYERFFWDGFWRLVSSRSIGMALGGIPMSEMRAYLDLACVQDVETCMMFIDVVSALDSEFLQLTSSKNGSR